MAVPALKGPLSRRLALSFAAVAALTMALAATILTVVWNSQFDAYVRENLQETATGAAELLGRSYSPSQGWSLQAFSQLPRFGMLSGLALQVLDARGSVVYDDSEIGLAYQNMGEAVPAARDPQGPISTAAIEYEGEVVGIVRVWPLSTEGLMSENDVRFRQSSFAGLTAVALFAVAAASVAGLWFAVTLVRPIDRITETAEALRGGDSDARTGMTGDDSIGILGRTFDEMADSIEADRQMERRLTADVAHELRTPLQAIQATVEAMQDGVLPADEERLGVVREETVRLARLADGILELTRLERGSVPLNMRSVDLSVPVRMAIDSHRALLDAVGLTLHVDLDDSVRLKADPDLLTQAVGNLISNAARYTPEGGDVTVVVRRELDRGVIEVSDTGIGIPIDHAERVFQRFWRADDARHRTTGGLGIGLAVVKEIVEKHGGTVGAARRVDGGSTFTIRLPL